MSVTLPPIPVAHAYEAPVIEAPLETIEGKISRIAAEEHVSSTTLYNLVKSESNFDPSAVGKAGEIGLVQILLPAHPNVTKEQALDPEFSLRFAAEILKAGTEYQFVSCSCWALAKTRISNLPRMKDLKPNGAPQVGGLILLNYSGVPHVAIIQSIDEDGVNVLESNFQPCLVGKRKILWTDKALRGFWSQAMAP